MVRGKFKKPNTNIVVVALAIAFVLYHLGQYVFLSLEWSKISWLQSAPMVQQSNAMQVTGTPSAQTLPKAITLGLQAEESQWPTRILIPAVGIDLALEGSMEQDGQWEVSTIGANFALNTAIPNSVSGNTAIFGHDRPGLFRPIHNLKTNDTIHLTTANGVFIYKVTGSTIVEPTDVSVMDQTPASTLTLITCDGWLSQQRYVVTARFDHVDQKDFK